MKRPQATTMKASEFTRVRPQADAADPEAIVCQACGSLIRGLIGDGRMIRCSCGLAYRWHAASGRYEPCRGI